MMRVYTGVYIKGEPLKGVGHQNPTPCVHEFHWKSCFDKAAGGELDSGGRLASRTQLRITYFPTVSYSYYYEKSQCGAVCLPTTYSSIF